MDEKGFSQIIEKIGYYRRGEFLLTRDGGTTHYQTTSTALEDLCDFAQINRALWTDYVGFVSGSSNEKDEGLLFIVSQISKMIS